MSPGLRRFLKRKIKHCSSPEPALPSAALTSDPWHANAKAESGGDVSAFTFSQVTEVLHTTHHTLTHTIPVTH